MTLEDAIKRLDRELGSGGRVVLTCTDRVYRCDVTDCADFDHYGMDSWLSDAICNAVEAMRDADAKREVTR